MAFSYYQESSAREEMCVALAQAQARSHIENDIKFRRWNSSLGGFYIPVSGAVRPNPYLPADQREIITRDGNRLALVNPAYMTRMIHEIQNRSNGYRSHLTSLDPVNPQNAPEPWEQGALASWSAGQEEYSEIVKVDGESILRLLRPLYAEQSCLECHAGQGFATGDVLGAISVSLPLSPVLAANAGQRSTAGLAHILIWLLGGCGILAAYTWQREAEKQHQQDDEKIRSLSRVVEQSPTSVVITDLSGGIVYVNPKFTEVTGYSQAEAVGRNPRILKSGLQGPDVYRDLWVTIKSGGEWRGEFQNRKKNGELYWEFASISPVKDPDGKTTHFVAVKEDIGQRKQFEQELKRQKEFVETVINSIPDSISILDAKTGRILGANEAFFNEVGMSRSEAMGRFCYETTHGLDNFCQPPFHPCPLLGIGADGCNMTAEHVHRDREGRSIHVEVSVFPIKNDNGEFTQVVHVARDITERKEAESAMRNARKPPRRPAWPNPSSWPISAMNFVRP